MELFDKERILILDGAMGTMIQKYGLREEDYTIDTDEGAPWNSRPMKGNNEVLNLTRPDTISAIHKEYIDAGADIIESNTFSANRISQAEYGCADLAGQMAYRGACIARRCADMAMEEAAASGEGKRVFVAGSMGPTSKSLSLSPDVSDPAFRNYSFNQVKDAYREQAQSLVLAGADLLLIETCFDALNVKAALAAIQELNQALAQNAVEDCNNLRASLPIPVIVSVSVGDKSGRTLTGQTLKAFYTSVRHYPLTAFGLNCSLGAADLHILMKDVSSWCECRTICYPNAGLPNEMGGYDQSPEQMATEVSAMAEEGLINITGGCCGTTPDHIWAIRQAVGSRLPRPFKDSRAEDGQGRDNCFNHLTVSGLECVTIDKEKYNFTNVGERTNVAGSRKFARLIAEGNQQQALEIAAKQIEDGASIIDINMDDAMLDSAREMERFTRWISNDPAVAKAALMIDSSDWDTILAGLHNAQGKCIVNSISLKEGEESFLHKALIIKQLGAAVVVMAFDEQGQATTFDRKIEICSRAYRLLTEKVGMEPCDIIFDCNILSIGTGIAEHSRYGVDFIEAVRWIKANLPGALTSGGLSNLSFAFRGNNTVREAMHSAFLYHAIRAGLDMAIVNPSMLQVYDSIESGLLRCVEDVIFDTDEGATERLISKASEIMAQKESEKGKVDHDTQKDNVQDLPVEERLSQAILKGRTEALSDDVLEALQKFGKAVDVIQGPLMAAMEKVGDLFGQGKMFLPQVVKSAKVMRDAVSVLEPYMENAENDLESQAETSKPVVVIATVKGDVHDIGKNITSIVLTCNGFEVHDLGVMVDGEVILDEAQRLGADIVGASGLITPSLFQMEELCRKMKERGMNIPLFVGGATTSALHTAVKLAPLYDHVYYGPDASATAVMAKKYIMNPEAFEREQQQKQLEIRELYNKGKQQGSQEDTPAPRPVFELSDYMTSPLEGIPVGEISSDLVMEYFDWKMFYAIWGIKYGKAVPDAAELIQLRRDAEEELSFKNFKIRLGLQFFMATSQDDDILLYDEDGNEVRRRLPMLRQEIGARLSLSDYVIPEGSGKKSVFGAFAISVHPSASHQEGCCCPACSDRYEELVGRTVRMTLAEAASAWLDKEILSGRLCKRKEDVAGCLEGMKVIKPAAGYASCPDHSLKKDLLEIIPGSTELGISLTESYAMSPDASICGMVFIHRKATYPEIRNISPQQYERYGQKRQMSDTQARSLLSHLLK